MEQTQLLDWVMGGLAFLVLIGGIFILFQGMSGFNEPRK